MIHDATDDVDTRAITRRLREDGSLIGVLTTEESKTDEELLEMSRTWDIVGKCFDICNIRELYSTENIILFMIQLCRC